VEQEQKLHIDGRIVAKAKIGCKNIGVERFSFERG
jgi:hypothetical protein